MLLNHKSKITLLLGILANMATVALGVLTLLGYLHSTNWFIELSSNFHFQYALVFLLFIPIMFLLKKPIWLAVVTFGFVLNFVTILPFYFQPKAQAQPNESSSESIKILHININYNTTDFAPLQRLVLQQNPDILVVVELPSENYLQLAQLLPEYSLQYHLPGRARLGMGFFVKPELQARFEKVYFSQHADYPSIIAQVTTQNQDLLQFALIHPPPPITERTQAIRNDILYGVARWAASQTGPTVVLGDFNATSWSKVFSDILATSELTDSRLEYGLQPSWPSFLPKALRIPIDHILIKNMNVLDRQILPSVSSDHLPVLIKLSPNV